MRVAIVDNREKASRAVKLKLLERLKKNGITINETDPEIVISIGGDGTLLSAFHQYEQQLAQINFVGIHTGHLGFYTDWRDYELDEFVESLVTQKTIGASYPLLEVKLTGGSCSKKEHFLALNESTIKRFSKTLVGAIFISDEFFESFRGDGLSVSTPTGSTAYNKSIGGAVIHPRICALQLAEVASLNNRVFRTLGSPLVIAPDEWITIKLADESDYILTIDQEMIAAQKISAVSFRIATEKIKFLAFRHLHFWDRVRESFITQEDGLHHGI